MTIQPDQWRTAFQQLEGWIQRKIASDGTPGLAIAVTDREKTLWSAGYGFADVAAKTPMIPGAILEIGSIGKTFTALLLMRMGERGQIDIHAPVSTYLPWFAAKSNFAPITVHHLLNHTSGIISGTDFAYDGRFEAWSLRDRPVSGPPGEHFVYSNLGYKVLGYLIEDVLGMSYGEAIRNELLEPLGMSASICPITSTDRAKFAVGYRRLYNDRPTPHGLPLVPDSWIDTGTGDGSIASTVEDMAAFARMILNHGRGLVSEATFERMVTSGIFSDGEGYGYGIQSWTQGDRSFIGHGGDMPGYYADLTIEPATGLAVIAMTNAAADVYSFATHALPATRVAIRLQEGPIEWPREDRFAVDEPGKYAGEFSRSGRSFTLTPNDGQLVFESTDGTITAEPRSRDRFLVNTPAFASAFLVAESDGDSVIGYFHGSEWFGRDGDTQIESAENPIDWNAFPGLYRSYSPWIPAIAVYLRRGTLFTEDFVYGETNPLRLQPDGSFQVGEHPSASRLRFDAVVSGKALRLEIDGQAYYRSVFDR